MAELILASASPRRLDLLRLAGVDPVVRPADVDEALHDTEAWGDYVLRVARDKVAAIAAGAADGVVVLGADTAVVLDGEVLGKPVGEDDARGMLRRLSGRTHTVATGVVVRSSDGALHDALVRTDVVMTTLSATAIDRYVATGEPLDKAGGYGIQGRAAAFVERIEGSYTNVVGLPLAESLALLRRAGLVIP